MVPQTNSQLKVPSLRVGKNLTSTLRRAISFFPCNMCKNGSYLFHLSLNERLLVDVNSIRVQKDLEHILTYSFAIMRKKFKKFDQNFQGKLSAT